MTDGTFNMLALAVHPSSQAQGHGAALVAEMESFLAAGGGRLLIVETSGANALAAARAFYRAAGYGEEATIRDFWAAGDDTVVFRKELA